MSKVIWLASWYPNEYEPVVGDFIQRHAKAVAELMPITVIHVVQLGKDTKAKDKVKVNENGNLKEIIHYFSYKKMGISWLDKLLYNSRYLRYYEKVLKQYVKQNGKPLLLHVHVPIKAGIVARKISKQWKIPYIVSEHSSLYLKEAKDNFYNRTLFFRYHTKKIFRDAAFVTNVSATLGNVIKQMFGLKEVITIPNVVNTKYFNYQPKEKNKIFRWLHVSTLFPLKNPEGIIHAFHRLSQKRNNWELVICGGPVHAYLTELVSSLELSNKIKFTGEIPYKKVAKQMQNADAFVFFSKHENFPCVIAEALCCGLSLVSSNVGGIAEAINKSNGLLVQSEDIDALKKALTELMDNRTKYQAQYISDTAIEKYNFSAIAKQFIALYHQLIKTNETDF